MTEHLPYGRQSLDEDDVQAVAEVLRSDWLTTGPAVDAFEERLAAVGGAQEAVALSSGTAALHAAYEAAGVGPGTEVVVPALTFSATANVARRLGARVRFADISPDTLTLAPARVESVLTPATRVVAPVDFGGHPAALDSIRELVQGTDAAVVQDAAHSFGGEYRGEPVGSIADMTCLSFHPVKAITSGEGGAVLTDDRDAADRMRRFRHHGMERSVDELPGENGGGGWVYDVQEPGLNYRLSDIHCALGLSQLEKLDGFIERRREIADRYRRSLADVENLELPPEANWCRHAYHLFVIRVPASIRRQVFEELHRRNIGVQVHYIPVNMLSAYREAGYDPADTPVALETYRRSISLPCFPDMDDTDVDRVAEAVRDVVEGSEA